ncbi:MAG: PKD domain-containing protein, partial [Verrucomicrobiota bacterium]
MAAKSIQDAIDISSDGDLILVTNGVYDTGGRAAYGALSNRVVLDRVVTVQSVNGPEVTWIVGNSPVGPNAVRCAYLTNGAVISGFTLTNGATMDAHQEDSAFTIDHVASGGGVWCESRTAIVTNCIIVQNTTGNAWGAKGGGAYSGSLVNCVVSGNRTGEGGGAYNSLIDSCTVRGNHADTYGGGLSSSSAADSMITGNSAYLAGGGIYLGNAIQCQILNNSARTEGGGAYNAVVYGGMIASNTAAIGGGTCLNTVTRCKIFRNQALVRGGGTDRAAVSTSAIFNNSAITNGGGVYGGSVTQSTIVGNHAGEGGGISGSSATNCVVFFNVAANGSNYAGTAFAYSCTAPLPDAGSSNISADPMFSDLYHLASGSPCIGLGTPEAAPSSDLDGKSWNVTPSMGCDEWVSGSDSGPLTVAIDRDSLNANPNAAIEFTAWIDGHASSLLWDFGDGSFATNIPLVSHEWSSPAVYQVTLTAFNSDHPSGVTSQVSVAVTSQPTLYVSLGSPNPTPPFLSWATAATNIQDAIDQAFAGGSTVLVSNGLYRTGGRAPTGVLTNRVSLDRPVTVRSLNGPEETIIEGYQRPFYGWSIQADFPGRGLGDSAVRCAYLCDGARLEGFTLTNGATRAGFNSFTTIELSGSGVWCESTNAAVGNCVIVSNICNGWGAGAYSGTLVNCHIISNKIFGSFGGGAGIAFSSASDCIISGNSDEGQGGGALSSTLSNCTVTANARRGAWNCVLINSTISSNDGPGLQGGSATGCVISGNNAGVLSLGGGATSMILSNCFISDNHSSSGGGVYNCVMNDCTLSNNSATVGGGAFWQSAGVVT